MITLMCRCAKALFPEKDNDINAAYEKVKKCSEYDYDEKLNSAITAVFKLFNQYNAEIKYLLDIVQVSYSDLNNLELKIYQKPSHSYTSHTPINTTKLTSQELNDINKSTNDFTKMAIKFVSNEDIELHEDFHKLFFGEGLYFDNYEKTFNLELSSENILDSDFISTYFTLKFLKQAQDEEDNEIIQDLFEMYSKFKLNIQTHKNKVYEKRSIVDFIFERYGTDALPWYAWVYINKKDEVHIDPSSANSKFTISNTNTKFRYTLDKNGNVILFPTEDKQNLYIPSTITTTEGKKLKVSGLGKFACMHFRNLSSVTIETETEFKINPFAFDSCSNLESVTLCSKNKDTLKTLSIGESAFNQTGITKFIIPSSVSNLKIESDAFSSCKKLTTFTLPSNNPGLQKLDIGNYAFSNSGIESFTVPDSISNLIIRNSAFCNCQQLTTFKLPSNNEFKVLDIGNYAFSNSGIESFTVPDSISNLIIRNSAFCNCQQLTTFKFPSNNEFKVLDIGTSAFSNSGIKSFTVPDSVSALKIGKNAFKKSNIKQFVVPENVENLELFPDSFETGCTVKIPSKFLGKLNFTEANYTVQYV